MVLLRLSLDILALLRILRSILLRLYYLRLDYLRLGYLELRISLSLNRQVSSIGHFLLNSLGSVFIFDFLNNLIHDSIHHLSLHWLLVTWNWLLSRHFRSNILLLLQRNTILNLIILTNWLSSLHWNLLLTRLLLLSRIPGLSRRLELLSLNLIHLRFVLINIRLVKVVRRLVIIKIIILIIIKVINISLLLLIIPLISIFWVLWIYSLLTILNLLSREVLIFHNISSNRIKVIILIILILEVRFSVLRIILLSLL